MTAGSPLSVGASLSSPRGCEYFTLILCICTRYKRHEPESKRIHSQELELEALLKAEVQERLQRQAEEKEKAKEKKNKKAADAIPPEIRKFITEPLEDRIEVLEDKIEVRPYPLILLSISKSLQFHPEF